MRRNHQAAVLGRTKRGSFVCSQGAGRCPRLGKKLVLPSILENSACGAENAKLGADTQSPRFVAIAAMGRGTSSMADIKFLCPECSQKIAVDAAAVGVRVNCPACHSTLI